MQSKVEKCTSHRKKYNWGKSGIDDQLSNKEMSLIYLRSLGAVLIVIGTQFGAGAAESVVRTPLAGSDFPISAAVSVAAGTDLVFVSGATAAIADPSAPAGSVAAYGNTEIQTISVFKSLAGTLDRAGLKLSDVVQLRVFLVGDPGLGGKMDFAGLQAGYTQFFGTREQPNLPARTTVQVASLAGPGLLVEIDAVAARSH
jgi:enamine deaminase RidA (YjgF/YER057c/UK114 family)